jgi:hypothetical protein
MLVVIFSERGRNGSDEDRGRDRDEPEERDEEEEDERHRRGIPDPIPSRFDPRPLAQALHPHLAGRPADGSAVPASTPSTIVWSSAGDEVIVHLDSLQVRILDGAVVASMDLESDQTGRAPVTVRFALAGQDPAAGLIATTDEVPGGHPVLAARWGTAVQEAVWASLLGLASDHAAQNGFAPHGLSAVHGALRLHMGSPFQLTAQVPR